MSELLAISALWVIITNVCLYSYTQSFRSLTTSSVVLLSKFPVGSSANIIEGLFASALAIATLCCWPPDNSLGNLLIWDFIPSLPIKSII